MTEDLLDTLTELDERVSRYLVVPSEYRPICAWLEWSVHGVPWLVSSSLALVTAYSAKWDESTQHRILILNLGLVFDLIVVGSLKLSIQRARPPYNIDDMTFETPVADQFSFPSGHATRAMMLATLCGSMFPSTYPYIMCVPMMVGISRVAMGRHYITDVLAGFLCGWLEAKCVLAVPLAVNTWFRNAMR